MITARAPGKVVLWGEYAVLIGAPAAVLAIDCYASCQVDATPNTNTWRVETRGIASKPSDHPVAAFLSDPNLKPAVIHHVLQALPPDIVLDALPIGATVMLDTNSFQLRGQKIGIGSSAAICVATYAACADLLGTEPIFELALSIHNNLQGKSGSGIDVAAAWHGGSLRYEAGKADPLPQLNVNQWQFLWTGTSASTVSHINRFRDWVDAGSKTEITDLATLSHQLFGRVGSTELTSTLGDYVDALRALDRAASLGIYGAGHERLHQLALDWQVVYKPCGAGGGDVGGAISDDPERLAAFTEAAAGLGFDKLAITRADHGVQISR